MVMIPATIKKVEQVEISNPDLLKAAENYLTPLELLGAAHRAWKASIGVEDGAFITQMDNFWQVYVNNGSHYSGDQDTRRNKEVTIDERHIDSTFRSLIQVHIPAKKS